MYRILDRNDPKKGTNKRERVERGETGLVSNGGEPPENEGGQPAVAGCAVALHAPTQHPRDSWDTYAISSSSGGGGGGQRGRKAGGENPPNPPEGSTRWGREPPQMLVMFPERANFISTHDQQHKRPEYEPEVQAIYFGPPGILHEALRANLGEQKH